MNRFTQGSILGERYELVEFVAAGGMGDVWRARDRVLGRTVAVKIMRPDAVAEPVFAQRFHDEARTTAGLSHHNIATLFDYGTEEHIAFLVMEFVEGESLSALIRREGALDHDRVRSIVGQMALALGAAHDAGVVHRDVKPANVLLTRDGVVKLTDFGIARATNASGLTRTGETLGTPHYLSPEQALGRSATAASDTYALGVVAHELLTGRRPFDKDTPVATAIAHVTDPMPTLPAAIPADLVEIISRCLAKEPEDRPVDVHEVAHVVGIPWLEIPQLRQAPAAGERSGVVPPQARFVDLMVRPQARILVLGARAIGPATALRGMGHDVVCLDPSAEVVAGFAEEAAGHPTGDGSVDTTQRPGGGGDGGPSTVAMSVPSEHITTTSPDGATDPAPHTASLTPMRWVVGAADRITREKLSVTAGFDAILWSGGGLLELSRLERADAFRNLAALCTARGRLVVEFATTPDYTYPEFRDDFLAGGLVPDVGFSGWDLRPMTADSVTTIVVLSRR